MAASRPDAAGSRNPVSGYSMCYMTEEPATVAALATAAAEADRLRARASEMLRNAVGRAAEDGLTQSQIARAVGRSQPEVSRLLRAYRHRAFRPVSPRGRRLVERRDEIVALAKAHRVSNIRVFGSVVRGDDDESSDIDLLVDLEPDADLLDLAALDLELGKLLGQRVDIVPARMLKEHVAATALAEAVPL